MQEGKGVKFKVLRYYKKQKQKPSNLEFCTLQKISFKNEELKTFSNTGKLRDFVASGPVL